MLGEAGNRPRAAQALNHQALAGAARQRSAITVPLYWSSLDESTPRRIDVTDEFRAHIEAMMNNSSVWANPNNVRTAKQQSSKDREETSRVYHYFVDLFLRGFGVVSPKTASS